ncbi:phage tail protein, partial [Vibrio aestuarianus]|uniref:phage tail-collar fiber domain-containing protein n=1 Tax=Vibrio aestuarianus TaxID=28171 RepID=UPI00237CC888
MSLRSAQEHTAVLTNKGKELLDAAYQSGQKLLIDKMSLGDANGSSVTPAPDITQLVNEFGRQDINEGNTQDHWFNAIVYVDSSRFAGRFINEFGLHDSDGNLIVYSSYPSTLIPSVDNQYVQIEIECSMDLYQASAVTINITPIIPHATELESGIARIVNNDQVDDGVDDSAFITMKKLLRRTATTLRSGVVQLSNSYQGQSESKAVTEKALKDGLGSVYSPNNLPPLILKRTRLYPNDLMISLLPIGQLPKPEWIMPAAASKVKFINIQTRVITNEPINLSITIFCHDSESGGVTYPSSSTHIFFSVPSFTTPYGIYNNFIVPITLADGATPKRLSFSTSSYGPSPNVVSKFDVIIDDVWE